MEAKIIMKQIEDISPTGIGKDYIKALGPLNFYLRSVYEKHTTQKIKVFSKKNLLNFSFRRYEEWFPSEEFENAVTQKNKKTIEELNKIIDELNLLVKKRDIVLKSENDENYQALKLFNEAMILILGTKGFDFKSICEKGDVIKTFLKYTA